jgi:hypothetical protein
MYLFSKHGFSLLCGDETIRSLFILDNAMRDFKIKNDYYNHIKYLNKVEKLMLINSIKRALFLFGILILKKIRLYDMVRNIYNKIIR